MKATVKTEEICMSEMDATRRRAILLSCALLVSAAAASLLPDPWKVMLHLKGTLHPWLHILLFGWLAAMSELIPRRLMLKIALVLSLAAFGAATELIESLRFHTSVEYRDLWTDMVGVLLGLSAALLIRPERIAEDA